ncbi:MAG: hypothetical protein ACI4B3_00640 [Prevotella sp.]
MAENTFYARVSRVENFFNMLLTKYAVSKQIFISQLPVTIKPEWNDMVMIDVGNGKNYDSHRTFSVNIYLYGRPVGDLQKKNVKVIDNMEELLLKAVSECSDGHYHLSVNWSDADYDSTRNFHFNVVNITVLVND